MTTPTADRRGRFRGWTLRSWLGSTAGSVEHALQEQLVTSANIPTIQSVTPGGGLGAFTQLSSAVEGCSTVSFWAGRDILICLGVSLRVTQVPLSKSLNTVLIRLVRTKSGLRSHLTSLLFPVTGRLILWHPPMSMRYICSSENGS